MKAPPPSKPSGTQIQSLQRGMRILELVGQAEDGAALGELARRMELGKTTVHNLARTLVIAGYLVQRREPMRYVLGPALFDLAGRQRLHALHERASPMLLELSAEFPGSAALFAEPAGTEVRVALRVSHEHPGVIERPLDRFSPPYSNATSLLFLAFKGEEERRAFEAHHPFWETATHLWSSERELENYLKQVRVQHHATLDQAQGKAFPIAVPLFSERGELLAALGLAYRSTEKITAATKRRLVERVRAAAARING
jgi:DNA-binding IclR family transcriptional regulator